MAIIYLYAGRVIVFLDEEADDSTSVLGDIEQTAIKARLEIEGAKINQGSSER